MRASARIRVTKTTNWYKDGEEYDVYTYDYDSFAVADLEYLRCIDKEDCNTIPMIQYKDMKFRVSDEAHSEELQQYLFSLGVTWAGGGKSVSYTHLPFLYIGPRGWLEYTDSETLFNDLIAGEYTLQLVTTVIPTLVAVEPRKTVLIGGQEVDEELVLAALANYQTRQE